jgi:hypothetical protein
LDNLGGSPGYDIVNVRVLNAGPPAPVPLPASFLLFGSGLLGLLGIKIKKYKLLKFTV